MAARGYKALSPPTRNSNVVHGRIPPPTSYPLTPTS